ncbi:hypothetical protein C9F11_27720 [Streptomyces sp. YIM 121038]|nr:hypothetical protein C9F11_27720 [Streptomyces sp. YIM 121038]
MITAATQKTRYVTGAEAPAAYEHDEYVDQYVYEEAR